jgi:hypothetical protein
MAGRSIRVGRWTLRGEPGGRVAAELALPAPERLVCEFEGVRLRPGHVRAVEIVGPVSMRTAACGVQDADAAMAECDELFDRLLGLGRPRVRPRRRGWCQP